MTAVLQEPTLVLNKSWMPIQTTTVREAVALVAKGSAYIIDPDTYEQHDLETWDDVSRAKAIVDNLVRSPKLSLAAPEVIVLTGYDSMGERSVVFSRRNLFKRDRYTCQYCGDQPGTAEMTIDHIMPKSRGGRSSWENCVLACIDCNKDKDDKTPKEAKMKLRKEPVKPSWKVLQQVPPKRVRLSWQKFLNKAYWETALEAD